MGIGLPGAFPTSAATYICMYVYVSMSAAETSITRVPEGIFCRILSTRLMLMIEKIRRPGWESDPSTVSGGIVPLGTVGLALAPDVGAGSDAPSERQAPGDFAFRSSLRRSCW